MAELVNLTLEASVMVMQDREWYREEQRLKRTGSAPKPDVKPVLDKPRRVFFVHYLAGFWPGLIAGLIVGFALGVKSQGFA